VKPGAATILCVEDEELQLQLRKVVFESAGFATVLARDGKEALELIGGNKIDAVVMDYRLTGMDGSQVAQEVKRLCPTVPVVILSGSASVPEEIIHLVDRWFQKAQIEPEELIECVTSLIAQRTTSSSA
jgi:CheY-like chemotaxis protein